MRYSKKTMDKGHKNLTNLFESGKSIKVSINGREIFDHFLITVDTDIGYVQYLKINQLTYLAEVVEEYGRVVVRIVHPHPKRE